MKLVMAVVQAEDAGRLLAQLSNGGLPATRMKTVGEFLRESNATVVAGVEDEATEAVVDTIRESCTRHQRPLTARPAQVGGATIFVLTIERSHVPSRDRLRNSRGVKRTETGQRFQEGFEAVRHLRRGGAPGGGYLVPGPAPHARVRSVVTVIHTLGHALRRQR